PRSLTIEAFCTKSLDGVVPRTALLYKRPKFECRRNQQLKDHYKCVTVLNKALRGISPLRAFFYIPIMNIIDRFVLTTS
ncbi:MAG: hypothetical protein ACW99A_16985, partial [Candidatus Kariarchaeaceae archaeon]